MHKFKLSIKIFSLLASLSSSVSFSASFQAPNFEIPDEETRQFFRSISYEPSPMTASSTQVPPLFSNGFSDWFLQEPQGANVPIASSFPPPLPLGRTMSFEEILKSMENDSNSGLESSGGTKESSPCLTLTLLGKGPMGAGFSVLDEEDSEEHTSSASSQLDEEDSEEPTSSASSHDSDEEEYLPPERSAKTGKKAKKRALNGKLEEKQDGLTSLKKPKVLKTKTSAGDRKREGNKISSRETRKARKNKVLTLESLAQQDPNLKKELNLIEEGLTPDLQQAKEQKNQEKESIAAKLKGPKKKQAVNAAASRYSRKVMKAKLELLDEYLAEHPEIDQASPLFNRAPDVLLRGRPRKKIPTN